MICSSVNLLTKPLSILTITLAFGLSGCGGGGDSSPAPTITPPPPDETVETQSITGGGVKGPLANAVVTVYAFDAAQAGFKGAAVGTASTDASAAVTGLALPFPLNPPYIMEFTSTPATTTDITTGMFPVITTMRTVITQASLDAGEQIYATPLTTMAVDIAVANAGTGATSAQFETALTAAAAQVVSTLGFGMDGSVNIFDTPPLINSTTVGTAEQVAVAAYRTAVEAVTAIAYQINQQSSGASTDAVLADLAADLADGGIIDGSAGTTLDSNTLQVLEQDPASLPIPNSTQTVAEVQAILAAETATTGSTTTTTELTDGTIITYSAPAETNPDIDNDGVLNVDDAFPENAAESVDTDGDGIGDVADPDDDNNGILDVDEGSTPAPTATDTDGDGILDSAPDNCINDFNPSQTNSDVDADGDACDTDDDNDGTLDTADAFPLDAGETTDTDSDGLGNTTADSDDDNDGVVDGSDNGVAPAGAPSEGVACSLLTDCDGDGVLDGADFSPVNPLVTFNFAPVANDDAATVNEDDALFTIDVVANDTDNDGNPNDTVTLTNIGATTLGTAVINANSIDYTPAADSNGIDTFTYTVTDGTVSAEGSVTVTITAINDDPVVTAAGPFSIAENIANAAVVGTVAATDVDSTIAGYSISAGNTGNAFAIDAAGQITVADTTAIDFESATSFNLTITASDGVAVSAGEVVTVDVTNVNDTAPVVAVAGPFGIAEDAANATVVGTVSATDIDSVVTSYSIATGNVMNAFAVDASGQITVADTSVIDFETRTSYNLAITATDGVNVSAATVVVVNISDVNDTAPVIVAAQSFNVLATAANSTVVGTVSASDADTVGSITGFNITAGNTGTAFAIDAAGQITVANTPLSGIYSLSVTATDSVNTSPVVTVLVTAVTNTPPVITQGASVPVTMDEDGVPQAFVAPTITATDAEGDSLSWSTPGATNGAATVSGSGASPSVLTYVPNADFNGSDSFVVNVFDGTSTVGITIQVTVNSVNDVPVAAADNNVLDTTPEDTPFTTQDVLANDDDGGDGPVALSVSSADLSSAFGGVVADNGNGTFDYSPPADFNGVDTFSYTVTDGLDTDVATVSVTVTAVNDAPVAVNDSESTTVDTFITTANVLTNDTDIDNTANELSVSAADATSVNGGTIADLGDGTFTYTPASGFTGADSFTYTVFDGTDTDVGTVTITVSPPGTSIAMSDLMGPANGGVAGLDSFDNGSGVTQFEYWTDTYNDIAGTFNFIDAEYNYSTGVFDILPENVADGFVLSGGNWVQAAVINVTAFGTGAGQSMDVSVLDGLGTEIESVRVSAQVLDISGERLDAHLNADWQAQMLDPNLLFTAGSKLITQYQFESLIDAYFLYEDDWCEFNEPARFAALGGNCNGINSSIDISGYATTLDQLIAASAWVDPDDGSTPPDAIFVAFNNTNNTALMVHLVTGGVANYYLIDWNNPDLAQRVQAPVAGTWVRDVSIQSVDMIRFAIPASLQPLFADDLDEGLNNLLAIQAGFVRQGDFSLTGDSSFDNASPLINGIAKDQVVANFDAPAAPDPADLVGTWVSNNVSINGDQLILHFFANGYYETSGTCNTDASTGMEYGTYLWDTVTGVFSATAQVATQGACGPEVGVANGNTATVSGDILTLSVPGFGDFFYSRLRTTTTPLVGSWVVGNIQDPGEAHTILTILDNGTLTISQDCVADGIAGFEYSDYLWDQATGAFSGNLLSSIDTNGSCGLFDGTSSFTGFTASVSGDTLTLNIPLEGDVFFARHSTLNDASLTCGYESGFNDALNDPLVFNSFTDFETVVADCGGATPTVDADVIGTWVNSYDDFGVAVVETWVFNANNTADFTETRDAVITDSGAVNWSLSNNFVSLTIAGDFLDVWGITPSGVMFYTELFDFSSNPDLLTLDGVREGEISSSGYIKQ